MSAAHFSHRLHAQGPMTPAGTMFNRLLPPVVLSLLLTIGLPAAKDVGPPRGGQAAATMFDEITDARERTAFREVWGASEPRRQRDLAIGFVEHYPRSILLK